MTELKLPELKENVEVVEVNLLLVKPGDLVQKDQPILEVQADKAALEVRAPAAGKIKEILVKPGDQLKIGQTYCLLEEGGTAEVSAAEPVPAPAATQVESPPAPAPVPVAATAAAPARAPALVEAARPGDGKVVPAGPATRRMARELGVDLALVSGTGKMGRVTQDDVKQFVRRLAAGAAMVPVGAVAPAIPAVPLPRFEDFGPVERQPLSKVRLLTAQHMARCWTLIPHVTQHDEADITDLEAFRKSQAGKGPKLTLTAFALKACAVALKQFPQFNSSLDLDNQQLILKNYYHIGVAVDTERGLVVPVIRDVDKKSVEALAAELNETAEKARKGDFDMKGGTFTISNLGGIGGTGFTPIVNHPEVAILGISRSKWQATIRDGQVVPRLLVPLSLSYDHRVIDGAAAARFTRLIAELLENPWMMALKG